MQQAVTMEPGRIEIVDIALPPLAPDRVRVRVEAVGVCGSDVHLFRGTHPYGRYPQTQGHEVVGVVDAIGADILEDVAPARGRRVVVEPFVSCGDCSACAKGIPNACLRIVVMGAHIPGALAEYIDVLPRQVYGTDLPPQLAVLVEPVSIGSQAAHRGGVVAGERVVVFGAGLVGLGALMSAADLGGEVAVVDLVSARLDAARALGARVAVDPRDEFAASALRDFAPDGFDVLIEATGSPAVVADAVDRAAVGGRVVIVGISERDVTLPMIEFTRKEIAVLGSRNNHGRFRYAEDLVERHAQQISDAVRTQHFPLSRSAEAIVFAEEKRAEVEKVVIDVKEGNR